MPGSRLTLLAVFSLPLFTILHGRCWYTAVFLVFLVGVLYGLAGTVLITPSVLRGGVFGSLAEHCRLLLSAEVVR